jgi:carbon storage regulator
MGLVLTRRVGEKVMIGKDVVVTVIECRSNQAKLDIVAPPHIEVDREEIRQRKEADRA